MSKFFQEKVSFINNIRRQLAMLLALFSRKSLRLLGRNATSFPGRVALRIYPKLVRDLCAGRQVFVVTGTNGKTSTTNMIAEILEASGNNIVANKSGANMPDGIVSSVVEQAHRFASGDTKLVLEVDEAWFAKIAPELQAKYILVTNLFNDQLDRYGDAYATRQLIIEGIKATPFITCLLCADDPLVATLSGEAQTKGDTFYYGQKNANELAKKSDEKNGAEYTKCPICERKLTYNHRSYAQIGDYYCEYCHLARPEMQVSFIPKKGGAEYSIDSSGNKVDMRINLLNDAQYNVYNTGAALLAGLVLDVPLKKIRASIEDHTAVAGRNETFQLQNGSEVCVILVKNAVGLNVSLASIAKAEDAQKLLIIINNNESDGRDFSWLNSVDYSALSKISDRLSSITISGQCTDELTKILHKKRINIDKIKSVKDVSKAWEEVVSNSHKNDKIYVLPNYTALLEFRNINKL